MRIGLGGIDIGIETAVRQECIKHYAFPRFLGRWVNEPQAIPLMLGIPVILLSLALYFKNPIEEALGLGQPADAGLMFAYSSVFPHWLLISFFMFFSLLVLLSMIIGVSRFWRALKTNDTSGISKPAGKSVFQSFLTTLKTIFVHDNFTECTRSSPRIRENCRSHDTP